MNICAGNVPTLRTTQTLLHTNSKHTRVTLNKKLNVFVLFLLPAIEDESLRWSFFHLLLHNRIPAMNRAVFTHFMNFLSHVINNSPVTSVSLANTFTPLFFGEFLAHSCTKT